jgi:hypothetical protein
MATIRGRVAGMLLAVLALTAGLLVTTAPAQAVDVDLHARMHATAAYPNAHGGAWYEGHHGSREFGIGISGIKKLAGKRVTVTVHGSFVGRMWVSRYGTAHLYRHSGVPRCSGGDVVRVKTRSGKLVSYGTLRHRYHHHMMYGPGMMWR